MMVRELFAAAAVVAMAIPAAAQVPNEEAEAAIMAWLDAIKSADPARLTAIMAPEFQIQRSDGTGYDRAAYAAGGFTAITEILSISDLVVTSEGDIMVARYMLHLNSTLDNRPVEALAPRLTVFRKEGDVWLVIAHANFARFD